MTSEFHIDFVTHDGYEYLAVEISFRGQRLCQMFRRKGDDAIEIEFVEDRLILTTPVLLRFPLDRFLEILEEGRKELLSLILRPSKT
jgi:hypothetical protein